MHIINPHMLWRQFDKTILMLEDALASCPPDLWETQLWPDHGDQWVAKGFSSFWYLGYHTLFWLDLYLTGSEDGFAPPAPFDLVEMHANETLPRVYTRDELLGYLQICRERCRVTLDTLTADQAARLCEFGWGTVTFAELQLYNMRHVQEHAAHLQMYLGLRLNWSATAQ
jgi:DinB superfamily